MVITELDLNGKGKGKGEECYDMLTGFAGEELTSIELETKYDIIMPLFEMVKQKSSFSIYLNLNGGQVIQGGFNDYEYTLSSDSSRGNIKERLMIYIDVNFNSITGA